MRIVVMGSGGTGGLYGAKLCRAGADVTFVARGAHLEAIRRSGLRIRSAVDGEWVVNVHALESLEGAPPADLVLFCVKSFDTEQAAETIRPVVGPLTGVLTIQNGVDNVDKLCAILGATHVIGGATYVFANIEAPGVVVHHQLGRIVCGELDHQISARLTAFADLCARASIPLEISPRIQEVLWEKYVFLTALAGTTALSRLPVKFIRETPETRRFFTAQLDELLALARAARVRLDPQQRERALNFLDSLAPTNFSSTYQDLVSGRRLELDALTGHAVRLGERYGVPTPALAAVYACLKPWIGGRLAAG